MNFKSFLILLLCLFLSSSFFAQETDFLTPELIADRPDKTQAPFLVPVGSLQIETGFLYERFESNNYEENRYTYNTTLLRYGLFNNLELRLGTDYVNSDGVYNIFHIEEDGFVPLLVGAKVHIAEENGLLPQIGLMGHLMLPFAASENFSPDNTGADFRFAFTHSLSDRSDFSYNLGAKWHNDATEATYLYTISYGYDITDEFGFYLEVYGDIPESSQTEHSWDGGFTYLLRHNLQLDILAGTGFNNDQSFMFGGGISYRIPR